MEEKNNFEKTEIPLKTTIKTIENIPKDTLIGNDFIIEEKIGKGGMGVVYKAYQKSLERYVAIKILKKELAREKEYIKQFREEAKNAAKLRHQNIVQVYGIGEEKGYHYFVMEYVPGKTLKQLIEEKSKTLLKSRKFIPVYDCLEIILNAAEGIKFAHKNGFLHRDIKPANIIQDSETKRMLIADFGLSKPFKVKDKTKVPIAGTPPFIAPEVFLGKNWTEKSDIYSLGATLYNLLTNKPPFEAKNVKELIPKIIKEYPTPPNKINPDIPEEVNAIVKKCLEKDPQDRYETVESLIKDIKLFINEGKSTALDYYRRKDPRIERILNPVEKKPTPPKLKAALKKIMIIAGISIFSVLTSYIGTKTYFQYKEKKDKAQRASRTLNKAKIFIQLKRKDLAEELLKKIIKKYPKTKQAQEAREILLQLRSKK